MLSRRKKQNLLYLGIGIVIGVVMTALFVYFGVISTFTKESIGKISEVFPSNKDTISEINENLVSHKEKQSPQQPKTIISDTSDNTTEIDRVIETDTVLIPEEIPVTIKTDIKIAEAVIPVVSIVKDTATDVKSIVQKGELLVEQWENPTNFAGYRKTQNKLVIYGIDIDDVELQLIDDELYLIYHKKKLLLKETDSFLHYPSEFIK
ncbi:MAG: hypothetical protein LBG80_07855 [Bacteroidales bacterium]|jgi:hypothetical protein|nr:hypothetical protein [Bacteroidales bacterium]